MCNVWEMEFDERSDFDIRLESQLEALFTLYREIPILDYEAYKKKLMPIKDNEMLLFKTTKWDLIGMVHSQAIFEEYLVPFLLSLVKIKWMDELFEDIIRAVSSDATYEQCHSLCKEIKAIYDRRDKYAERLCERMLCKFLYDHMDAHAFWNEPVFIKNRPPTYHW